MSNIIVNADVPTLRLRTNAIVQSTDYEELENLPKINSVELKGNKPLSSFGIQSTLVSGTNIKTLNEQSLLGEGNININSAVWGAITGSISNQTDLQDALDALEDDIEDVEDELTTLANSKVADVKLNGVSVVNPNKEAIIDTVDNVTSTSTAPLTANQGKYLNDRINNISNIGKFLSLWNLATGLPETNPDTLPYTYHTGDYYRIGVLSEGTCYVPNGTSYTGDASTTVGTGAYTLGAVFYFDGSVWRLQASGGGGTVQDVRVNNVSVLSGGIANIPNSSTTESGVMTSAQYSKLDGIEAGAEVNAPNTVIDADYVHTDNNYTTAEKTKLTNIEAGAQVNPTDYLAYSEQTLTASQKAQARANTDSFTMEEYNPSATSYEEGVIYYTVEA